MPERTHAHGLKSMSEPLHAAPPIHEANQGINHWTKALLCPHAASD